MIRRAAISLAKLWAEGGVIPLEEMDAYQYGMELLFSTALNIIIMIFLSVVSGNTGLFIPYLVTFIPLRIFAGGYHTKRHFSCILFNTIIYSASIFSVNIISSQTLGIFCFWESMISTIATFLFAPVPAKNKPLSDEEYRRGKFLSRVLTFIILVVTILLCISGKTGSIGWIMMCFGQSSATVLLLMEVFSTWHPCW